MGSNGATFDKAYYTYALCCPSRATFLRGQYPHNHQIIGNGPPSGGQTKFRQLGLDQSTVATWLDGAGCQTKLVGKYMNSYDSLYVPPGWDEWYAMMGDHWGLSDPTTGKMNDDGVETPLGGHSTDVFADKATDFIRRGSVKPEPFFVVVGTKAPHAPPEVATRYQDSFVATPLPRPPNFDEAEVSDKPQWVRQLPRLTQSQKDRMQSEYRARLRSILSVEDLLRRVVATLRETGELGHTYVVFTSDNGYHIGNHRLGLNKTTPYEEDTGMPLMVRGPGVPAGAVRQQLVLNANVAPTIADLAGVSPRPSWTIALSPCCSPRRRPALGLVARRSSRRGGSSASSTISPPTPTSCGACPGRATSNSTRRCNPASTAWGTAPAPIAAPPSGMTILRRPHPTPSRPGSRAPYRARTLRRSPPPPTPRTPSRRAWIAAP